MIATRYHTHTPPRTYYNGLDTPLFFKYWFSCPPPPFLHLSPDQGPNLSSTFVASNNNQIYFSRLPWGITSTGDTSTWKIGQGRPKCHIDRYLICNRPTTFTTHPPWYKPSPGDITAVISISSWIISIRSLDSSHAGRSMILSILGAILVIVSPNTPRWQFRVWPNPLPMFPWHA